MEMMDGVLELRWEDQLKQDVPKPQCMVSCLETHSLLSVKRTFCCLHSGTSSTKLTD